MQLQEAQELVRRACQILLIAGGGILIYLGVLRLRNGNEKKLREAVILGFLVEHNGKNALSCPVVNLGKDGELRPVAVHTLKLRWKQSAGQTMWIRLHGEDYSHVTFAEEQGKTGFAMIQILCGFAVALIFALRMFGV